MENKLTIHLIGKIRDAVHKYLTKELKNHGLKGISPSHGDILGALCINEKLQMRELANLTNRDKSTITALVNKLIVLGYLEKESDEIDNRISWARLSEKGKSIEPDIQNISKNLNIKANKGLTLEELTTLNTLLIKVFNNF